MRSLLLCAILGTSDGSLRKWLCCGHDAVSQVADQKRPSSDTRETSLELVVNPVQQKDDRQHTDEVLKEGSAEKKPAGSDKSDEEEYVDVRDSLDAEWEEAD